MKNLFIRLFFLAATLGIMSAVAADEAAKLRLTVVSFNIRIPADKAPNDWPHRKARALKDLRRMKPDIFGLQEATPKQIADLKVLGYRHIGRARGRNRKGEGVPIFYDPQRFELVSERTVWLSKTPEVYSLAEGANMPRIVTVGVFRDKRCGRQFVFANTHLHHRNTKVCHPEQIRAVIDELTPHVRRGTPVILTGDFNSSPSGVAYKELKKVLRDAYLVSEREPVQVENRTCHGFSKKAGKRGARIDYVWVTPEVKVLRYESVNNFDENGLASSDHYPQLAEVEF